MEFMCGQIKSMRNNEQFVNSFTNLAQSANMQMNNFDATSMATQMDMFNNKMDEMMINNKMIGEIMEGNKEMGTDSIVEDMKNALQQEILMEEKNKMEEQYKAEEKKEIEKNQGFLDELKGLWLGAYYTSINISFCHF